MSDRQNANINKKVKCSHCNWPVITCLNNDGMGKTEPYASSDYWMYCSNKTCENHAGGEASLGVQPDFVTVGDFGEVYPQFADRFTPLDEDKLFQFTDVEHSWEYEGITHGTIVELVHNGFFKNCGCGIPNEVTHRLLLSLELIVKYYEDTDKNTRDELKALWGNETSLYFFWYWCDVFGLVEHGIGLPGWLSPRGQQVLELLCRAKKLGEFEGVQL